MTESTNKSMDQFINKRLQVYDAKPDDKDAILGVKLAIMLAKEVNASQKNENEKLAEKEKNQIEKDKVSNEKLKAKLEEEKLEFEKQKAEIMKQIEEEKLEFEKQKHEQIMELEQQKHELEVEKQAEIVSLEEQKMQDRAKEIFIEVIKEIGKATLGALVAGAFGYGTSIAVAKIGANTDGARLAAQDRWVRSATSKEETEPILTLTDRTVVQNAIRGK